MIKIWKITAVICLSFVNFCSIAAADKAEFASRYENARLTTLAAQACAGVYVAGGRASEFDYLKQYGFTIIPYAKTMDGVGVNFMVATNPNPYNGKYISVLAIRGSADKGDWNINFKTKQVPFLTKAVPSSGIATGKIPKGIKSEDIPKVHEGFNAYTLAALKCKADIDGDGVVDDIAAKLKANPNHVLLITGHSLGGAVATLYGEYLVRCGVPREQIPVITFGAPAVGNRAFAGAYGDKINLRRIVTSYDPVPGSLQSFFGGYKQFGVLDRYKLSGTYTDFQHPISFYFDLALKNFYGTVDEGVEAGYLPHLPLEQTQGTEPMVALAITAKDTSVDDRYVPDIRRFALEEYLALLPRYVLVESNMESQKENVTFEELLERAAAKNAQYLIALDVKRQRINQTDQLYVSVNQGIFEVPSGRMITMDSGNKRIRFNQGAAQATIALVEDSRNSVKTHLPFVKQRQTPAWKEMF